ncbi:aldose epimerase family protein [Aspergillus undulatus]|uniref:aldose epimerase family protein n=1 Tax=Aspergillus undulatus TaxID=1810928 RepID=UPI003CCD5DB2
MLGPTIKDTSPAMSQLQLRELRFFVCPARFSPRVVLLYCYIFLGVLALLIYTMYIKHSLPAFLLGLLASTRDVSAAPQAQASPTPTPSADAYKIYTISADNITAKFIPLGARLTSLLVPDRDGVDQDVVVGFDDVTLYGDDDNYYGPVVGRYANRIKNGTFTIADNAYHIPTNENDGLNSLHGGEVGYDKRNWTVTAQTNSSITFSFYDRALEGFPGDVLTYATYTVDKDETGSPQLTTKLVSLALTNATPIMLANHIYWNLNGFRDANLLEDVTLHLPLSNRFIATDGILIPNGTINTVDAYNGAADFTSPKLIGRDIDDAVGLCGTGCTGYDNCWIIDRPTGYSSDSVIPALYMASANTGITLEVSTNTPAIQIFDCNGQDGSDPVKPSQIQRAKDAGFNGPTTVGKNSCLVVETEGWIDGINQPGWGQLENQIFTPQGLPAVNLAVYKFGTD